MSSEKNNSRLKKYAFPQNLRKIRLLLGEREGRKNQKGEVKRVTQGEIAELLKGIVTQAQISKWEKGESEPHPAAIDKIALTFGLEKEELLHGEIVELGVTKSSGQHGSEIEDVDIVYVPLIRDTIAAGPKSDMLILAVGEEVEWQAVAREDVTPGNEYRMIRLTNDSMSPIYEPGSKILVNFSRCDPRKLVGTIVAAWCDDGATVKWLLDDGKNWRLHPQNPLYKDEEISKKNPVFQVAAVEGGWVKPPRMNGKR